jgi:selenocysteine lyase/cysteine desulfurase
MKWQVDSSDYSQFATDAFGYFYRVSKVFLVNARESRIFYSCSWSETNGLRTSPHLYNTMEEAKASMDNIAALEEVA